MNLNLNGVQELSEPKGLSTAINPSKSLCFLASLEYVGGYLPIYASVLKICLTLELVNLEGKC